MLLRVALLFLISFSNEGGLAEAGHSGYLLEKDEALSDFDSNDDFNLIDRDLLDFDWDIELPHIFSSNGDVRLVSNDPYEFVTTDGRLEVYSQSSYSGSGFDNDGSWGTVCGDKFSLKEAHVACRQMGFAGARKWEYASDTEFGAGNDSTPILLAGVRCPKSSGQHILRCKHDSEVMSSSGYAGGCDHSQDVAVFCNQRHRWDSPYRGQVRLISNSSVATSYGRVEVFQSGQWGTVCSRNFNQYAADSVCRQLGYTGAVSISDAMPGSGLVWVDEISCSSSKPCFTYCFTHHTWTHKCNHTQDVAVQCTFDASQASSMSSGDGSKCKIRHFPLSILILCVSLALATLTLCGCMFIFCFVITRCCKTRCYRSPKARRYDILS